jgi:holo-[acyl-carrier protein] synthase
MIYSGVDLIEISRVWTAKVRHGERFLQRVFTARELAQCQGRAESLAGRFAAKEAAAKALGTGLCRDGIGWTDIEIGRDEASGAPTLYLHGAAAARAQRLGWTSWSVSLSHDRERVIAFVVALGDAGSSQLQK